MTRNRRWIKRIGISLAACVLLVALLLTAGGFYVIDMPGSSYAGDLPPLTPEEVQLRDRLRHHIEILSNELGERNAAHPDAYYKAEAYIADQLRDSGCATTLLQPTTLSDYPNPVHNIQAEIPGTTRASEIVIIGAHYDTVPGSPGANDNGTGLAATIEIARLMAHTAPAPQRTIRFLAFYNEERVVPAGSKLYADLCRQRNENVVGMISLETIGYYTDAPGSQKYPFPFSLFYPSTGNFLAFVGNTDSRGFVHDSIGAFRASTRFPSRGVAAPEFFGDTGRSDHVYFWRNGYPALMITDTANFRYAHYHRPTDTPDKIDFDRFARVTLGLSRMLESLAFSSATSDHMLKASDSSPPASSSASQPAPVRAPHPSSNPSAD